MAVISFRFTRATDAKSQEELLAKLRRAQGVKSVGRIDAESPDEETARMCFAETVDPSVTDSIVEQLHDANGVEAVAVERRRGLA